MKKQLYHIYIKGRFGPENHIGFVIADSPDCLKLNTYIVYDIRSDTDIHPDFWTNPLGINGLGEYTRWKMSQKAKNGFNNKI